MTARMPLIAIMVATLGGCDSYARMSPDFLKYNAPPERELPPNTPSQLEQPLSDLHHAVEG